MLCIVTALQYCFNLAPQPSDKAGLTWHDQARALGGRDWSHVGEDRTRPLAPPPTPSTHTKLHELLRHLNGSIGADKRGAAPVSVIRKLQRLMAACVLTTRPAYITPSAVHPDATPGPAYRHDDSP